MTTAFAALLIGVAGAALVLALVAYFWVNRTPSPNERFDAYGRVPLFGVDLVATTAPSPPTQEVREPAFAATEPVGEAGAESDADPDPHASYKPRNADPTPGDTRPRGNPVVIDTSALGDDESQDSASRQPSNESPPRHHQSDHRFGGRGWGTSPGWPAPEVATPRYVPPITRNPRRATPRSESPTPPPDATEQWQRQWRVCGWRAGVHG